MPSDEVIRIYVGVDRSQELAVPVLEHSIRRHTSAKVEVIPMLDLPVPTPVDPRNSQRTGFSFSRFCIPKLAGYSGKAIYMDADMLVFSDIRELWNIPFDGAKIVIQQEVKFESATTQKIGAPKKRKKQCAVMLLDCSRLDWDIEKIVAGMDDGKYDYEQLMYDICILDESEVKYGVPFEWNSLEHWDSNTHLIHYTDVYTQPWTACGNRYGYLWLDEVRRMLAEGKLTESDIQKEVELGYFRPSLLRDIKYRHLIPSPLHFFWDKKNSARDKLSGYVPHKAVYEAKRIRQKAIKAYEVKLQQDVATNANIKVGSPSSAFEIFLGGNTSGKNILIFTEHVNATYFISFDAPLRQMHATGEINFAVASQDRIATLGINCWKDLAKNFIPDVVIMTRYAQPYGAAIVDFFRENAVPVIYHIDDNLLELPSSLGEEIQKRQGAGEVIAARAHMLSTCDIIYASTPYLASVLKRRFPQQRFIHGIYASYPENIKTPIAPIQRAYEVIGYMGSKGHQHDLELVVPAIERLLVERPTLRFETFGTIRMPATLERFGDRVRSHSVQKSYTEFLNSLAALNWDIGLAPLVDAEFNRCKAPTKFIEYTACGIPVAASDISVYHDAVPPGGGVLIHDDWYENLERLLTSAGERREMLAAAQAHCRHVFAKNKLQKQLSDLFKSVLMAETE